MRKDVETKWQKIPDRNTPEWKELMGICFKNLKLACIAIKFENQELSGLHWGTVSLVKAMQPKHGKLRMRDVKIAALGVALKEIQPHLKPWVKISKAKLSKELRWFIIEGNYKSRKRTNGSYVSLNRLTYKVSHKDKTIRFLSPMISHSSSPRKRHIRPGGQLLDLINRWNPPGMLCIGKNEESGRAALCVPTSDWSYVRGSTFYNTYQLLMHEYYQAPGEAASLKCVRVSDLLAHMRSKPMDIYDNPSLPKYVSVWSINHGQK